MSFKNLNLLNELLQAIEKEGYTTPTPIQQEAIPLILEGGDLMAAAQTGTGKTAGFTLPVLQRLMNSFKPKGRPVVRALILTPTRELAAQVEQSVRTYGRFLPLRTAVIFGGVSINPQIKALRNGVDIIIATPGRLLDHVGQNTVDLSHVETIILDEADRMLDMGFIPDIRRILALVPQNRQSLLFSATFSNDIKNLAASFLKSPKIIEMARQNAAAELVTQIVHPVDNRKKTALLSFLISSQNLRQVLVFTRTKHGANKLAEKLEENKISNAVIHGNKTQAARTRALAEFKRNSVRVLVATDIAARGLDIDDLPHVVNFELPDSPEDYVHRIGRTGRAGNAGKAISLVCIDEHKLLSDIERMLKTEIESVLIPGYEPDPSIRAEPIFRGRRGGGGGGGGGGRNFRKGGSRNGPRRPGGGGGNRERRKY